MEELIEQLAALKIKGVTKTAMSKMTEDEINALAAEHLKEEVDEVVTAAPLRPMSNAYRAELAKKHSKDKSDTKNTGGSRVGAAIMQRVSPVKADEPK